MNEYHDTTLTIIENRIAELEWVLGDDGVLFYIQRPGYEKALHIKNEIKVLKRIRKAHLEDVQYWKDKTKENYSK